MFALDSFCLLSPNLPVNLRRQFAIDRGAGSIYTMSGVDFYPSDLTETQRFNPNHRMLHHLRLRRHL